MKDLFDFLSEGLLDDQDIISSTTDEYIEVCNWIQTHVKRGRDFDGEDFLNIAQGDTKIIQTDGKYLAVSDCDNFFARYGLYFEQPNEDILDNITFFSDSHPGAFDYFVFKDDAKIKNIDKLYNITSGLDDYNQLPPDGLKFINCSFDYIDNMIKTIRDIYNYKKDIFKISIEDPKETDVCVTDYKNIMQEGLSGVYNSLSITGNQINKLEFNLDESYFTSNHSYELSNKRHSIKCKKIVLNLDIASTEHQYTIYMDCLKTDKLEINNADCLKYINISHSKILNLGQLIQDFESRNQRVIFDSNTKTLSKIKPNDLTQKDILGQVVEQGDYVLCPVTENRSSWGSSGLRLYCSKILSRTGLTINVCGKSLPSSITLKVPEEKELFVNLQDETHSINGCELKKGDIIAYCNANHRFNSNIRINIGKIENVGKTIAIDGRRFYPNCVYKIDKEWLKKNDKEEIFKNLY